MVISRLLVGWLLCLCTAAQAAVTISWEAPTTRTDGTLLPASEIRGYALDMDGVTRPGLITGLSVTLTDLTPGVHCFVLRTVDTEDRVSDNSEEKCREEGTVVVDPPDPPPGNDIPTTHWSIIDFSSFEADNWLMRPEYAYNRGDPAQHKLWHSRYTPDEAQPPHHITIDLGDRYHVTGFRQVPRAGGGNAVAKAYQIHLSVDGVTWARAAGGLFPPGDAPVEIPLSPLSDSLLATSDGSMLGRYVKFTCLSEQDGGMQCSVDELHVYGNKASSPAPMPPIMVQ